MEGVQLYGGTKHTTTTETAKLLSREAAKAATGHTTDKAFLRYCQTEGEEALAVHRQLVQKRKKKNRATQRSSGLVNRDPTFPPFSHHLFWWWENGNCLKRQGKIGVSEGT